MFTQVLLKTVLPDGTIALASMWISNENTTCIEGVQKGHTIISRECPERYQMTSLRWMDSSDDITKIVGQSCVPCKPLCCPPTLLTLPLKMNSTKVQNPRRNS